MPYPRFRFVTEAQLDAAMVTTNPRPTTTWLSNWVPLIENEIERYLGRVLDYETGIVEWFSPSDDRVILLDRRPVHRVTEVRVDQAGGFGQLAGTFGPETVLTAGTDYFLSIDGRGKTAGQSDTGLLFRVGRTWGYMRQWDGRLLGPAVGEALGTVKVTYDGGYKITTDPDTNQIPGTVVAAVCQAAGVWFNTMTRVGVTSGESVEGYSWNQVLGVNLGDNIFASIRGMLTSLKSLRPGAGRTP